MIDLKELTDKVALAALKAGDFIQKQSAIFETDKIEYKGVNDLVSYVDKTAEEMIVKSLQEIFPEAGFITEENTIQNVSDHYNWIIDPLDGTTNFIHRIPVYAVSIALEHKKETILGVVLEVNRRECFTAYKNGGAFLNTHKIEVTQNDSLSKSLIATGFPYTNFDRMDNYFSILKELMRQSHGLRRLGSAAVDLCYVACGRFDGFFEYNLNSWDVAAGALIVKEAGGKVTDFKGDKDYVFGKEIVASNRLIHEDVLAIIQKEFNR
jgi:myo-inositol-1(or 4)-monophosphatase